MEWAKINEKDITDLLKDIELKNEIMKDIEELGRLNNLSGLERPKDIYLTSEPFSIENNILTPTMKLKRNVCKEVYRL